MSSLKTNILAQKEIRFDKVQVGQYFVQLKPSTQYGDHDATGKVFVKTNPMESYDTKESIHFEYNAITLSSPNYPQLGNEWSFDDHELVVLVSVEITARPVKGN